jgi:hypothetical protein
MAPEMTHDHHRLNRAAGLGIVVAMDGLGVDLLLLSARPDGTLAISANLRFGISGSELVRLAAARRVGIEGGRIVVLDTTPTGDQLLDEALASMTGGKREPTAKAWVAIDAATQAAVHAATHAAQHGGAHGGAGGHH